MNKFKAQINVMKKRLKTAFALIAAALSGIIMFQIYWTINAYKLNKENFDHNINIAMQKAMDDCKADYLDSLRSVSIKHLSPPETILKIDTLGGNDTLEKKVAVRFTGKYNDPLPAFKVPSWVLDYYAGKLPGQASVAAILTEMSFDMPDLRNEINILISLNDTAANSLIPHGKGTVVLDEHDFVFHTVHKTIGIYNDNDYTRLANYNNNGLLNLSRALKIELSKLNINSPFSLSSSNQNIPTSKPGINYSETFSFPYKHPMVALFYDENAPFLYVRAVFHKPQYAVLKSMLFSLTLSFLLMFFTLYCFYYISSTIISQRNLADLKDDFINNMTHELKTPITTISVAIEGLQSFNALNDPEKTGRYLQTSKNQLTHLNDLVTKVLDIAAFESKKVELNKDQINVDELFSEVIISEKSKTVKTVNIAFENKSDIRIITADKIHFRNVISNLIDNAVKYSPELVDINIAVYKSENDFVISVKDNGIGIPSSHIGQIFIKFHRVPTGNVHTVKGSGLGLSYVKYIVEAHNGTVQVKSELNKGSEFIVSLPLNNG